MMRSPSSALRPIHKRCLSSKVSGSTAKAWIVPSQARLAIFAAAAITVGAFALFPLLVQPPTRREKPAVASSFQFPSREQLQNSSPEAARRAFFAAIKDMRKALPAECFLPDTHQAGDLENSTILPRSAEDASAIIRIAAKHCILVNSRNSTALPIAQEEQQEQTLSMPEYSISLDFTAHMNSTSRAAGLLTLQPGITMKNLGEVLKEHSLTLASNLALPDSNTTLLDALDVGSIRDCVVSLKVVLPNGELLNTSSDPSHGPNLTSLFLGTTGSLGLIVEASLKVQPAKSSQKTKTGSEEGSAISNVPTSKEDAGAKIMQQLKTAIDPQGIFPSVKPIRANL